MSSFIDTDKLVSGQYRDDRSLKARKSLYHYLVPAVSLTDDVVKIVCALDPKRVVDAGCGNGDLLIALRKAGFLGLLYGFDVSPGMLHAARTNIYLEDIEDIYFATEDLGDLGSAQDNSVDCLIAKHVLHHIAEISCTMREIHRTLSQQGTFIGVFHTKDTFPRRNQIMHELTKRHREITITTAAARLPVENMVHFTSPFSDVKIIRREALLRMPVAAPYLECFQTYRDFAFDPFPSDALWNDIMAYVESVVENEITEQGYFTDIYSAAILIARK